MGPRALLLYVAAMRFWLLLIAYVACAIIAYLTLPNGGFIPYGLATWCGGALFVLLVNEYRVEHRRKAACRVRSPYADRGMAEEPGQLRP